MGITDKIPSPRMKATRGRQAGELYAVSQLYDGAGHGVAVSRGKMINDARHPQAELSCTPSGGGARATTSDPDFALAISSRLASAISVRFAADRHTPGRRRRRRPEIPTFFRVPEATCDDDGGEHT